MNIKIILFFVLIVLFLSGCSEPKTVELDWDEIRANDIAKTSDEWGTPKLLDFSTNGWEEAPYISPNEKEFFFIYTNIDVFHFILNSGEINI
ncbi:hypothetical protein IIC68_02515, partial [archaeon]|nr:hypothetical protein [archaeon]